MPRYGYSDPADYYQESGFDPYSGRLNGGALVMSVLNQIAGNKQKKKQEQWDLEDRELNKRYKEAQIANYGEQTAQSKREYETPEQRAKRERENASIEHRYRMREIKLQTESKKVTEQAKTASDEEKLVYADKKRLVEDSKKARVEQHKFYKNLVGQIDMGNKRIAQLKTSLAKVKDEPVMAAPIRSEIVRVESEVSAMELQRQSLADELLGKSKQKEEPKDKYGFSVGEIKFFPDGQYKYIGDNKWQQVK